jgi:drug/metabolite transporter (DMT)-like permease
MTTGSEAPDAAALAAPGTDRPGRAALWMLGSIAAFTALAVAGRAVSHVHDTFEIMAWRSAIGLVIVVSVALALGRAAEIRRDRFGRHIVRNIVHFTGQNLWFYALATIPLAQVFALEFTSPIWVVLLSPLFLGERLTRRRLAAAALGFAGILVVARPDFARLDPGVIAAAASALCFATTMILTKVLTRGESALSIMFWLTLIQLGLGILTTMWDGHTALPTAATLPWLVLIGVGGLLAHFCLTTALSLAPASVVVPVDFLRLPVAAALGWFVYAEPLDAPVLAGAALIFTAIWLSLRPGAATRGAA